MKTQNTKLNYKSTSVIELNDSQLHKVAGGSPVTDMIEIVTRATTYGTWFDFVV